MGYQTICFLQRYVILYIQHYFFFRTIFLQFHALTMLYHFLYGFLFLIFPKLATVL